jgi:gamma-glutamylcyclotransferase (GGCT)/AIG2-like uncharacterized protein YtfP
MPTHLFVYGTLHPDRAPAEIAPAVRHFHAALPATVHGRFHNLGPYPAVRLDDPNPTPIPGTLFQLPDNPTLLAQLLAQLDAYEGFDPAHPATSLFLRQATTAILPTGQTIPCWIYTYNHPLPEGASKEAPA